MKKIIFFALFLITNHAYASQALSGNDFLETCQSDRSACVLMFAAVDSGVTDGHLLIDLYRIGNPKGQPYKYFCWAKIEKLSFRQRADMFATYLKNLPANAQNVPLGIALVKYYHDTYPSC